MSAKRSVSRASEADGQKRAQWSTQSYTVEELLQQFTLPQVVKCNSQAILVKRDTPLPFNLSLPMLLFDSRTVRKLLARNVTFDQSTGKFCENDETVVIPKDYEGSFLRLRSRTSKDHTKHKTIESLAQHSIKAFLNLTKLSAFHVPHGPTATQAGVQLTGNDYPRIDYLPGNVFAIDSVFHGTARVKQDSKFLNHKKNAVQQLNYLKCRDEKNNNILIPMTQNGEFVEIMPSQSGNGRMSVQSEELIANPNFPLVVRYVRGRYRPRLSSFTGLFTLLDSYEETTIVGCMLDSKGLTLIELPLASPLTFHLALNMHELQNHPVVKSGLRLCDTTGHNFARDLKYKFKFSQRFLQIGGRKIVDDTDDIGDPPSARGSARVGVTATYIYL